MSQEESVAEQSESNATEQQTLDGEVSHPEGKSRNYRYKINELYKSDKSYEQAIGFWGKFLYEYSVKSSPIAIIVAIGALLRYVGLLSYSYQSIFMWGLGISTTVTFVGWCMSEGKTEE